MHLEERAREMLKVLKVMQIDGEQTGFTFPCPRCGHTRLSKTLEENPLSRREDIYICSPCGRTEALLDMADEPPLPLLRWGMFLGMFR